MDSVISRDGTAIAYERAGDGPPLIFVAGLLNDHTRCAPLAALLAPHFTTVTYDRRGKGDSGDTAPYAIDREIDDLDALIAAVGGAAAVFGYSSGAILALLAAARGTAITRLLLYEPAWFPVDDGQAGRPVDLPERVAALVAAGRPGDAVALFQTAGVGMPAAVVAQLRQSHQWPALERMAQSVVYDATLTRPGGVPLATLSVVPTPALVLHGSATFPILREAARVVADALPHAQQLALPGVGNHDIDPEATAPALRAFLAASQGAATARR